MMEKHKDCGCRSRLALFLAKIHPVIRPLSRGLVLWISWIVLFQLMRFLLIVATDAHRGDATLGVLAQAALHGLRFDAAIAGWLVAPFAIWWIWRTTPRFAALAREGILFDRALSVSTHTAPGVFGTLCSFPILPEGDPGHAFVKRSGEPLLGWVEKDSIFVGSVLAPTGYHRFGLGFPPHASDDLSSKHPEEAAAFSRKLDAMVVTGLHTLENRLAALRH